MITGNSFQEFYIKGDKSGRVVDIRCEIKGASFFRNREMKTCLCAYETNPEERDRLTVQKRRKMLQE